MPFHIFKRFYPRSTEEHVAAMKNDNIKLRTCNSTTKIQLGRCTVKIENNNKIKMCSFFVVSRTRQPLLGMPDIETLGILTINSNTIKSKEADGPQNCKADVRQEIDAMEKHYTNTDGSKFQIEDEPTVNDNNDNSIKYFLPGPQQ